MPIERFPQDRVDGGPLIGCQAPEWRAERVGDGPLGGDWAGKCRLVERIGTVGRAPRPGRQGLSGIGRQAGLHAAQRSARQADAPRQTLDALGLLLAAGLTVPTEAIERDWGTERLVGPMPLLAVLDVEIMVEQPPPEHDRLAGELRIELVDDAFDRDPGVAADLAPLRLSGEGAEALPAAHRP